MFGIGGERREGDGEGVGRWGLGGLGGGLLLLLVVWLRVYRRVE